jgi:predicted RNA-binding protein YlqC (UPF0109 family)
MRDFIEYLAKRLVDNPEEVQVTEVIGEKTNVYELQVGDGELGKIIGKQGHTIQALRTILIGVATKENKHVVLELLE